MTRHIAACALLLTAVLTAGAASAATVHRCTVNGRTVFQQTACGTDAALPGASAPASAAEPRRTPTDARTPASGATRKEPAKR